MARQTKALQTKAVAKKQSKAAGKPPALSAGRASAKTDEQAPENITIRPPNLKTAIIEIRGVSPYVQNRFDTKIQQQIKDTQMAGSVATSKRVRKPKDFDELYKGAMYLSREGWNGIPAAAFRDASISVCRLVGFKMTHAKMSFFVLPDCFDKEQGVPLVRIIGKPRPFTVPVRLANGSVDMRIRPIWDTWGAKIKFRWDAGQFSTSDIANLLSRAGAQCGVGEGRANSRESYGQGWGHFEVVGATKDERDEKKK